MAARDFYILLDFAISFFAGIQYYIYSYIAWSFSKIVIPDCTGTDTISSVSTIVRDGIVTFGL
jgi:hypothetical protein